MLMRILFIVLGIVSVAGSGHASIEQENINCHVVGTSDASNTESKKIHLALVLLQDDAALKKFMSAVKDDLAWSGQCDVSLVQGSLPETKGDLEAWDAQGYPFVLFVSNDQESQGIDIRMYDAFDIELMQGKRWHKREPECLWAHVIAQGIWKQLMGNQGSFTSRIAYIKKNKK